MPNEEGDHTNDVSGSKRDFIAHLKQYKEFIAILVFFVGGFMWIFAYFATKESVDEVRCIADNIIILVDSRMEQDVFTKNLAKKGLEHKKLSEQANLSKEEKDIKLTTVDAELHVIRKNLNMTMEKHDKAHHILKMKKC